jgi:hypothetical protein
MERSSHRDFGLWSSEVHEILVLKIRDFPNPDMPMALSFSELFPSPRIYATRWGEMDGPDSSSGYRDLRCSVDTMCLPT